MVSLRYILCFYIQFVDVGKEGGGWRVECEGRGCCEVCVACHVKSRYPLSTLDEECRASHGQQAAAGLRYYMRKRLRCVVILFTSQAKQLRRSLALPSRSIAPMPKHPSMESMLLTPSLLSTTSLPFHPSILPPAAVHPPSVARLPPTPTPTGITTVSALTGPSLHSRLSCALAVRIGVAVSVRKLHP